MSSNPIEEARRQVEICNACRYCEGYCAVFPAITWKRAFSDGDITQFANLCHNCRGCYYACQYTPPHEFALNLPKALAEVRQASWKDMAYPRGFALLFDRSGVAIAVGLIVAITLLFWLASALRPEGGNGFYAYMSHSLMVTIFAPAFILPLLAISVSIRRYWMHVGGGAVITQDLGEALHSAGRLTNLAGGHGEGCNYEDTDRYSNRRRAFHHATLIGFLLCFASTSIATVMHYAVDMEAPYALLSLPKLFGVTGGLLLCVGAAGLAALKMRADRQLGAPAIWGGEMAFILLLFTVSGSGLVLYAATGTSAVPFLLAFHLGTVLTFFLITPYSKMVHGFYRLAALTYHAAADRTRRV